MPRRETPSQGLTIEQPPSHVGEPRPVEAQAPQEARDQKYWEGRVRELKEGKLLTDSMLEHARILLGVAHDWEVIRDADDPGLNALEKNYDGSMKADISRRDRPQELVARLERARQQKEEAARLLETMKAGSPGWDWNPVKRYAAKTMLDILMEDEAVELLLPRAALNNQKPEGRTTRRFYQTNRSYEYDLDEHKGDDVRDVVDTIGWMLTYGPRQRILGNGNLSHHPRSVYRTDVITLLRVFADQKDILPYIFSRKSGPYPKYRGITQWVGQPWIAEGLIGSAADIDTAAKGLYGFADKWFGEAYPIAEENGYFYRLEKGHPDESNRRVMQMVHRKALAAVAKMRRELVPKVEEEDRREAARQAEELEERRAKVRTELPQLLEQLRKLYEQDRSLRGQFDVLTQERAGLQGKGWMQGIKEMWNAEKMGQIDAQLRRVRANIGTLGPEFRKVGAVLWEFVYPEIQDRGERTTRMRQLNADVEKAQKEGTLDQLVAQLQKKMDEVSAASIKGR